MTFIVLDANYTSIYQQCLMTVLVSTGEVLYAPSVSMNVIPWFAGLTYDQENGNLYGLFKGNASALFAYLYQIDPKVCYLRRSLIIVDRRHSAYFGFGTARSLC